jgi:hypothetical protein
LGNAQFQLVVDGKTVGPVETVTTQDGHGWQDFNISAYISPTAHTVGVEFLNDLYSPGHGDRNLYVNAVTLNNVTVSNGEAEQKSDGTLSYDLTSHPTLWPATTASTVAHLYTAAVASNSLATAAAAASTASTAVHDVSSLASALDTTHVTTDTHHTHIDSAHAA